MKVAIHKLFQRVALLSVLVVFGSAHAFNPQPEPPATPPIGMTADQTVVVNVSQPPDQFAAGNLIQVQLGLFDAAGVLRLQIMAEVSPGKIVSMEISGDKLGIPAGDRMSVQGVVQCTGGPRATSRCAQSINASMELYNSATGITNIVVPVVPAIIPGVIN